MYELLEYKITRPVYFELKSKFPEVNLEEKMTSHEVAVTHQSQSTHKHAFTLHKHSQSNIKMYKAHTHIHTVHT